MTTGSRYRSDYGPNVEQILSQATRVVRGRIPREVRRELSLAVRAGVLGHLKRDGLKPEVFFHPDHRHGALERQAKEAAYAVSCIAQVLVERPVQQRIDEAIASLRSQHETC